MAARVVAANLMAALRAGDRGAWLTVVISAAVGAFMLSRHRRRCAPQRPACAAAARSARRCCSAKGWLGRTARPAAIAPRFARPAQSADRVPRGSWRAG